MRSPGTPQQSQPQRSPSSFTTESTPPQQLPPLPRHGRGETASHSPPLQPASSAPSDNITSTRANGGKALTARNLRDNSSALAAAAAAAASSLSEAPLAAIAGGSGVDGASASRASLPLQHSSDHTSMFSSAADAPASLQQGPPRGTSPAPALLAEPLSWRAMVSPMGTLTSPLAFPSAPVVPNHSCFSKAKGTAHAAGTSRTPPPPPPPPPQSAPTQALSRTAPAGKAPAAVPNTLFSVQRRPPHRRGSANVRASVLATSRHRRLMPLAEQTRGGDGEEEGQAGDDDGVSSAGGGGGAAASTSHRIRGGGSGVNGDGRSRREPGSFVSSPTVSDLSSCRAFQVIGSGSVHAGGRGGAGVPAGSTETGDHGGLVADWMRAGSDHRSSYGSMNSRASDIAAARSSSSDVLTASLTSLQQRLWTRTAGHGAVMTITTATPSMPKVGRNRQRPSFPSAASLHGPASAVVVPVAQWNLSLDSERVSGELGKHVANWMVERLLNPASGGGLRGGGGLGFGDTMDSIDADEWGGGGYGGGGGGYLRPLCDRAVVATYLLSTLLGGLPRHQQSLSPYVHMLLDFTFVSDAAVNRAILGGSVQDEELLHALEVLHDTQLRSGTGVDDPPRLPPPAPTPAASALAPSSSASTIGSVVHRGSRSSCHIGAVAAASASAAAAADGGGVGQTVTPSGNGALYDLLYPNFTRKTYAAAHYDAAGVTVALAHEVRSRELHQRNVPRVLDCMHRHLMRWLMRAVLHAWRGLCRERRVQEQRQRTRWAARWTSERVRISLRRWRGYAALTLEVAEADSVAMAVLSEKRAGIERLEKESAAMQASCETLRHTLHTQDEEREELERVIVRREQYYKKLLRYVREMDRVGSLMLRSLLLSETPPVPDEAAALNGANAAIASIFAAGQRRPSRMSITGSFVDLLSTESDGSMAGDDEGVEMDLVVRHPAHALVALPTLLRWAKACVESVEPEYTGFFPDEHHEDEEAAAAAALSESKKATKGAAAGSGSPRGKGRSGRHGPSAVTLVEPTPLETSLGASSRVGNTETTRGSSCGLELLLSPTTTTAGASATAATATCSAADTVLTPLHMLLLLMRGCATAQEDAAAAATATTAASSMVDAHGGLLSAGSAGMDNDAGTTAGPSWDMIRTIELADRAILDECAELLRRDEEQLSRTDLRAASGASSPLGNAETGAASVASSGSTPGSPSGRRPLLGSTLMYRLASASRENLLRMCRVVVDAYEQLTGTACIVTAEQLFGRSRGTLLVLVAALMRYYTNWSTHRAHHLAPSSSSLAGGTTSLTASRAHRSVGPLGTSISTHEGARHKVYEEWSHPPYSHRGWLAHVQRQAQWIALSFSALHDAVRLATTPTEVLSIVEQERVSQLVQHIPLTEFIDVLCRSPEHTMQSYVDMIGVLERYAPSLHLVFHQYALPLSQLRADEAVKSLTSGEDTPKSRSTTDDDLYITGNTLWHLLQLTGLAGKVTPSAVVSAQRGVSASAMPLAVPSPPLSATLHRPAVFSLIEQVTQGSVASTGVLRRRGSTRRASVSPVPSVPEDTSSTAGAAARPASVTAATVSCQGRPIPCYARALRDDRHVDLRADTGAVCLDYVQFVKVMIRLAHAWQCQQQQQPLTEASPVEEAETSATLTTPSGSQELPDYAPPASSSDGALSPDNSARALSVVAAASSGSGGGGGARRLSHGDSGASGGGGTAGGAAYIQYEAIDYADPLCPPHFTTFLGDLLLPRLLGANRWMGATQRAVVSKPVLEVLARHHDSLLAVFEVYQRPCETRGVRGGLPPPFSTILASRVFGKFVDAERGTTTSLTVDGGGGLSHAERASFVYAIASNPSRGASVTAGVLGGPSATGDAAGALGATQRGRASTRSQPGSGSGVRVNVDVDAAQAAASRDIGIVSVLRWKEVQTMGKDLAWYSEPRVTELALRHCFDHVVADAAREGEVLFFAEFLRLLCAISVYVTPNMMVPLERKLEAFLKTRVLTLLE